MLLTVAQAADRRKVTRFSIHRWLRNGLKAARYGSQFLIDQKDLDAYEPRKPGNPTPQKNGHR